MEPSPNCAKPLRYYELPPETFQVVCREGLRHVPAGCGSGSLMSRLPSVLRAKPSRPLVV